MTINFSNTRCTPESAVMHRMLCTDFSGIDLDLQLYSFELYLFLKVSILITEPILVLFVFSIAVVFEHF